MVASTDAILRGFCLLGFGFSPGPPEMLLLLVIALLLYGGKLPEVARSWGKSFAEFRRGLTGIQHDLNEAIYSEPDLLEYRDDAYSSASDEGSTPDEQPPTDADPPNQDAPTD